MRSNISLTIRSEELRDVSTSSRMYTRDLVSDLCVSVLPPIGKIQSFWWSLLSKERQELTSCLILHDFLFDHDGPCLGLELDICLLILAVSMHIF